MSLLDEKIDKEMYIWEVVYIERVGYVIEIVVDVVDKNIDIVVVVGGDGIINEIVCLLVYINIVLGIIFCGFGNGLVWYF